ncbi:MAG: hypothetical protein ACOX75_01615 [Lachnospiraceae bacterium]|jgi:hypothetical protein
MKTLLTLRNHINSFYSKYSLFVGYGVRVIVAFFVLLAVKNGAGYNSLLSQVWFIIAFAIVSAFMRTRLLVLALAAYTVIQVMSLSMGVGVVLLCIILVIYMLYFRLDEKHGMAVLLVALLHIIKIPLAAPLMLPIVSPVGSVIAIICGNILYYAIHYLAVNSAVITGMADAGEVTKATMFLNGIASYKEFFYVTLIMIMVSLVVYFAKRIPVNRANDLAIIYGTGLYIILMILINMMLGTITFPRLRNILIGGIVSFIVAFVMENIILPLDFARTELLEFQDDEYYYYVKAVPKAMLEKENVSVTRISSRKKEDERMDE